MKKHWLGRILLGASLALLLAGGAALAASLYLEIDQECFECWPARLLSDDASIIIEVPDEYRIDFTVGGYGPAPVCWWWRVDGDLVEQHCAFPPAEPPTPGFLYASCDPEWVFFLWGSPVPIKGDVSPQPIGPDLPFEYGEWNVTACQGEVFSETNGGDNCDEVSFLFAEDCEVAMHVPEPGTIVLLGSGLAGLAGYAGLRLRARRKRED